MFRLFILEDILLLLVLNKLVVVVEIDLKFVKEIGLINL